MAKPGLVWVRLVLLLLLGILLQTTLMPDLQLREVRPDLMLLITICVGLTGGPEQGAIAGFGAGLLTDMFMTTTPVGLCALTMCLVGFIVGSLRGAIMPEVRSLWLAPGAALVATAGGVVLFVLLGVVLGQSQLSAGGVHHVLKIAIIEGVWNAILAVPTERAVSWASGQVTRSAELAASGASRPGGR